MPNIKLMYFIAFILIFYFYARITVNFTVIRMQ